jgi:hypothetical protein
MIIIKILNLKIEGGLTLNLFIFFQKNERGLKKEISKRK